MGGRTWNIRSCATFAVVAALHVGLVVILILALRTPTQSRGSDFVTTLIFLSPHPAPAVSPDSGPSPFVPAPITPVAPPNPLPANYIPPGEIHYGKFLNTVINFLIVAATVYLAVVLPVQKLLARIEGPKAATIKACPQCLSEIPVAATRCKFCTQPVG